MEEKWAGRGDRGRETGKEEGREGGKEGREAGGKGGGKSTSGSCTSSVRRTTAASLTGGSTITLPRRTAT
jgi:hypothetical protein